MSVGPPWVLAAAALSVALLGGCETCGGDEPQGAPRAAAGPRSETAILEGTVRLAEGAELPTWPDNPMAPANRPPLPEHCTPPQESDRQPVRRLEGDRLAGVVVGLRDFENSPPREPATHDLFIRDCRLTPSFIAATRGDRLHLVNETDYPFLPNLGTGIMQAVLHRQTRDIELPEMGIRTLSCGFAASCGRAEIMTFHHGLHTMTDEQGHFRIEGVPVNDALKVGAWHPLFVEALQDLTLRAGETRRVEIVITPAPTPDPAPARDPAAGPAENNPDVLF